MLFINRKQKQYLHLGIPAAIIFLLAAFSFSNVLSFEKGKDLFIISLLIINPALFIKNGIYTARHNLQPLLGFIPSIISFSLVYVLWLNPSALIYFAIYTLVYSAGYGFIQFDRHLNQKNEQKEKKKRFYGAKKL